MDGGGVICCMVVCPWATFPIGLALLVTAKEYSRSQRMLMWTLGIAGILCLILGIFYLGLVLLILRR
jgi:hypothetical protein